MMPTPPPRARTLRWGIILMLGGAIVILGFDGLTRNWAELEVGAKDPRLEAIVWPHSNPEAAVEKATQIVQSLSRWKVETAEGRAGTLHATHQTRLWRFVDDIHLKFSQSSNGTTITGQSRSRVGKGDLGQNARNLRELAEALRQAR